MRINIQLSGYTNKPVVLVIGAPKPTMYIEYYAGRIGFFWNDGYRTVSEVLEENFNED